MTEEDIVQAALGCDHPHCDSKPNVAQLTVALPAGDDGGEKARRDGDLASFPTLHRTGFSFTTRVLVQTKTGDVSEIREFRNRIRITLDASSPSDTQKYSCSF